MGASRCFDHFTNNVLKACKLQLIYPLALELHVPSIGLTVLDHHPGYSA